MTKRIEEAKAFVENSGLFQGIRIKEGVNCLRLTSTTDSRIDSIEDTQESSSSTELSVQSGPGSTTEDSDDDDNNDPGDRRPDDWLELVWVISSTASFWSRSNLKNAQNICSLERNERVCEDCSRQL